jgi:hypothetical protein
MIDNTYIIKLRWMNFISTMDLASPSRDQYVMNNDEKMKFRVIIFVLDCSSLIMREGNSEVLSNGFKYYVDD